MTTRTIKPFQRSLGTTRITRQVPGLHTLYVGPAACARHGFYANAHLHSDYISYLSTTLVDVSLGRAASMVMEAVGELMRRGRGPIEALMLYSGCQDTIVCTDFASIARNVERSFGIPTVHFGKNRMFVEGKGTFFPDFHKSLFELVRPLPEHDDGVNLIGSISRLRPGNDLSSVLEDAGLGPVRTLKTARTYADFARMACSRLNVVADAAYLKAALDMERRLGIPYVHVPLAYHPDDMAAAYKAIEEALGVDLAWRDACERVRTRARALARPGACEPFVLDGVGILHPYSCARALASLDLPIRGVVTMLDEHIKDPGTQECMAELRERCPDFAFLQFDYKANMPVVEELEPLELECYGFQALDNLLDLIEGKAAAL